MALKGVSSPNEKGRAITKPPIEIILFEGCKEWRALMSRTLKLEPFSLFSYF